MNDMEIIHSMSEGDALLALQAARAFEANDVDGETAALKEMSTDGLDLFTTLLEGAAKRKGIGA